MSDKFISNFGTLLKIKINNTYETIKGVYNVPAIESEQEKIEVTHHDQGTPYRKYIPSGLIGTGDFVFGMRSDRSDSTQQELYSLYKSGEIADFEIVHPDGLTQEFQAYVIGMTYNAAEATSPEPTQIDVTLAISGDISDTVESL